MFVKERLRLAREHMREKMLEAIFRTRLQPSPRQFFLSSYLTAHQHVATAKFIDAVPENYLEMPICHACYSAVPKLQRCRSKRLK